MRSKKIIKAGLKKLILFTSEDECEKHLQHLADRKIRFRILEQRTNDDDTSRWCWWSSTTALSFWCRG